MAKDRWGDGPILWWKAAALTGYRGAAACRGIIKRRSVSAVHRSWRKTVGHLELAERISGSHAPDPVRCRAIMTKVSKPALEQAGVFSVERVQGAAGQRSEW